MQDSQSKTWSISLEVRNLMERIIEYVKDRTRLFDNYMH
jgi:hypothetical protein